MTRVLVVGDVINDVIIRPTGPTAVDSDTVAAITAAPGGSGANQAAWLASLHVPVRLAARVGAADVDAHRELLTRSGVDAQLSVDPDLPTGSIAVLIGEDATRSMFTDRGANSRLGGLSADLLEGVGHLHVSGYAFIEPDSRSAVASLWQAAGDAGLTRSVDVGSAAFLGGTGSGLVEWTRGADIVFANLAEGRLLTATGAETEPDEVVTCLLGSFPVVVLKLGGKGAVVATGSERVSCPPPGAAVVDPTGAGDAFCAGFLARWLAGASLAESGTAGAATASAAMALVGGRPPPSAAPTTAATWERLREAARSASASAYAPYSNLHVGAAGLTDCGEVVTGCNVENASFGLTLCAECGLVSALRVGGGQRLLALSVVAGDGQPLAPCGRCRQILVDNGGPDLLIDRGAGRQPARLGELLPGSFDAVALAERRDQ